MHSGNAGDDEHDDQNDDADRPAFERSARHYALEGLLKSRHGSGCDAATVAGASRSCVSLDDAS
jgi:hypothetical protein